MLLNLMDCQSVGCVNGSMGITQGERTNYNSNFPYPGSMKTLENKGITRKK